MILSKRRRREREKKQKQKKKHISYGIYRFTTLPEIWIATHAHVDLPERYCIIPLHALSNTNYRLAKCKNTLSSIGLPKTIKTSQHTEKTPSTHIKILPIEYYTTQSRNTKAVLSIQLKENACVIQHFDRKLLHCTVVLSSKLSFLRVSPSEKRKLSTFLQKKRRITVLPFWIF